MLSPVEWKIKGGRSLGPAPFLVFGIVNVTPDSFHDGGQFLQRDAALAHAREQAEAGAHVLDIGGESSRPYADPVPLEAELARVLPVVEGLQGMRCENGLPWAISVDTYKAGTAAAVLDAGVEIINDISAFTFDPGLLDVLGQYKPGYVLMHSLGRPKDMQRAPEYADVVEEILDFFEKKLKELITAGVPESRIMLDPGVGFGKTLEHNIALLRGMDRFASLGLPLMAGISNKSMFGALCDAPAGQRQNATQAATAILASRGVFAHRVHDVALTVQTLKVAEALAL
ncbi:dihydropteroate synthase [Desulfovibrio mangrovi]|uniref:dihydropteroate synthase n=1 Tax=Desulfovibrio mangrovi TaxID=2976983 RepID=UPI00224599EB|nr:dihydropteroate synthase [Desulfovibrio mangrovi]UZP68665.1 dihydropteroate synthase [Desulfovibrio mangrovi]